MPVPVVVSGSDAVSVRNTLGGPTVLTPDLAKGDYLEWQGKGDPTGRDIQLVSPEVMRNANFQRMLKRGVLEIIDDEAEIARTDALQQDYWEQRQSFGQQLAEEAIDRKANNDSIVQSCIGPGARGGESKCGENVVVKESAKDARPPLCPHHEELADQFVATEMQDGAKTITSWMRITMGERQYQAR